MFDIWHSTVALLGLGGVSLAGLAAVAYFFPPFRKLCIEIGAAILAVMAIYAKGVSDQKKRESQQNEKAVQKAQKDYAKIDARPDTSDDVTKRLRDGSF